MVAINPGLKNIGKRKQDAVQLVLQQYYLIYQEVNQNMKTYINLNNIIKENSCII